MRMTCVVIMMVMMCCKAVVARAPKGCQISTLNGTFSGESWTPSVEIKSQVTLALKSPAEDPWREINVEFESKTGANVGTLQLLREGSSAMTLSLSSWPTSVHSDRQKTQTLQSHGVLNNLLQLQDWVYFNISAGQSVKVDLQGSSVEFKELNARAFKKLYVRVPEEEVLQVAFNCGKASPAFPGDTDGAGTASFEPRTDDGISSPLIVLGVLVVVGVIATGNVLWLRKKERNNTAKSVAHATATEAPEPEKSGSKVIIVALVLAGLAIGVAAFWCIGRKKRNALVQTMEEKENAHLDRCQDCGDPIEEVETGPYGDEGKEEEGEELISNDLNKCQECGDVIDDQEAGAMEGEPHSEEECVCPREEE